MSASHAYSPKIGSAAVGHSEVLTLELKTAKTELKQDSHFSGPVYYYGHVTGPNASIYVVDAATAAVGVLRVRHPEILTWVVVYAAANQFTIGVYTTGNAIVEHTIVCELYTASSADSLCAVLGDVRGELRNDLSRTALAVLGSDAEADGLKAMCKNALSWGGGMKELKVDGGDKLVLLGGIMHAHAVLRAKNSELRLAGGPAPRVCHPADTLLKLWNELRCKVSNQSLSDLVRLLTASAVHSTYMRHLRRVAKHLNKLVLDQLVLDQLLQENDIVTSALAALAWAATRALVLADPDHALMPQPESAALGYCIGNCSMIMQQLNAVPVNPVALFARLEEEWKLAGQLLPPLLPPPQQNTEQLLLPPQQYVYQLVDTLQRHIHSPTNVQRQHLMALKMAMMALQLEVRKTVACAAWGLTNDWPGQATCSNSDSAVDYVKHVRNVLMHIAECGPIV